MSDELGESIPNGRGDGGRLANRARENVVVGESVLPLLHETKNNAIDNVTAAEPSIGKHETVEMIR